MEIQLLIGLAVIGIIAYLLLSKRKPAEVAVELPVLESTVQPPVETVVEASVAVNPVAVALDLEPAALATPVKKPRKPRAAKVEVAPVKVKSVVKKAAPKKEAAKKPAVRTVKSKKV
jgi:uncharacterized membrane protein